MFFHEIFVCVLEYIQANSPWQKIPKIQDLVAKVATFVPIWRFFPYLLVTVLSKSLL